MAVTIGPESGAPESRLESNQLQQPPLEPAALTLAPGQSMPSRYLGLMLFYPALQVVGLLELAAQVYHLAGMVRFGVQQVFTELFCLALLQEPSVERVKHVLRSDLGAVMGRNVRFDRSQARCAASDAHRKRRASRSRLKP